MKELSRGRGQGLGEGSHQLVFMSLFVFPKGRLLDKPFPTIATLQWLLACVCHFVVLSICLHMKTFLAEAAFELLSIDVNLLVSFQEHQF